MYGIYNGMVQPAFCNTCRNPWQNCPGRCSGFARPVNRNGRIVRLLNPQGRPNFRYRGQPTVVYCNGCGSPYSYGCCGGAFSPVNAMGEILMLDGLMDGDMGEFMAGAMLSGNGGMLACGNCFGSCVCGSIATAGMSDMIGTAMVVDGLMDGNPAEVAMGAMLSCGNCFGSCSCGAMGMMGGFANPVQAIGTIEMLDGIADGDPGEAAMGAALAGEGVGGMFEAAAAAEVVDMCDGDNGGGDGFF